MAYRYIGKASVRKDAIDIVTGRAKYLDDINLPNMAYGRALRSSFAHAIIKSIDASRALQLPGVYCVLTYKEAPDWVFGLPRHLRVLDKKVRYVGDVLALVAADRPETAAEALDLISVEYELLPTVFDPDDASRPDAPRLYEQLQSNVVPSRAPWLDAHLGELQMGDVEQGLAKADYIVEGEYRYDHMPNPLPPEPPGAIAMWENPKVVRVWLTSQSPYFDRMVLYYVMNKEVEVRLSPVHCGGSYGSKGMAFPLALYAILLSKACGRPVKFVLTKQEHLTSFLVRLGSRFRGKVGIAKDGKLTAIVGEWIVDTGGYCGSAPAQVPVALGEAQLVLRCNNWDVKSKIVLTNKCPAGWVRGFGGQELKAALLPLVMEAVAKTGRDPVDFFKENVIRAGEGYYWRDARWYVSKVPDFCKAIDEGARVFGWKRKWKGWLVPSETKGSLKRGVGVSVHSNADVGEDVSEAYVRLDPDHFVTIYCCVAEQGTGQRSNLCKMVAEILNIDLDRVKIVPPDPELTPYEFGLVGSRGTYAIGKAVIEAAEQARAKLLELASYKLGVRADFLDTADGIVFSKRNPELKIRWKDVMDSTHTILGIGRFIPDFTLCNFLITFVEVEVDSETGIVKVSRIVNATDVGQVIDPPCIENQLNGCLGAAGLDTAVFEETVFDGVSGRVLTTNMLDYKWRTFLELPQIQNVILETPFPSHRFGAIGVGEVVTSPGIPAVLMAVSNALGTWIRDYPLTPDKVLSVVKKH